MVAGAAEPGYRQRLSPPPRHDTLGPVLGTEGPVWLAETDLWDAATRARLETLIEHAGLAVTRNAERARTAVHAHDDPALPGDAPAAAALPPGVTPPADNPEAHALTITSADGLTHITLAARAAAGHALASRTLAQLWTPEGVPHGGIADWPGASVRGLIEGFYGTPWTPEARASMLAFLGAHKFNTYVYGPKDDPFHRGRWRDPYPPDAHADVVAQHAQCRAEGLRFVYSLAPGLDIRYSNAADTELILAKYRTFFDAGVRHFGLYFDDIPYVFLDEADVPVYGEATPDDITPLGVAQAHVASRIFESLRAWDAGCALIFCPVEYWGTCESGYVHALRDGMPAEIDVFYTGPDICSERLESAYTQRVSAQFGRPVTFWDNYPANDAGMTGRLHLNPVVGRDPGLFAHARGIICNPMTQCEASKVPVATIGEYLWAPDRYDPAAAFERAVAEVASAAELPHLKNLAANMHFCCLHETESETLHADTRSLLHASTEADEAACAKRLLQHLAELGMSCTALRRLSNERLRAEIAPWVDALAQRVDLARAALGVLRAPPERRGAERAQLQQSFTRVSGIREETCGPVVAAFAQAALNRTA